MQMGAIENMTIKDERIKKGWTQTDLSYFSRVPAAEISRIECGRLKPSAGQLERLAKALKIKPEQLAVEQK
jgi:transcriptional regulator with XRE-family HTH domain